MKEEEEEEDVCEYLFNVLNGYSDSLLIPSIPSFNPLETNIKQQSQQPLSSPRRKKAKVEQNKERERRASMNHLFSTLKSLLPNHFVSKETKDSMVSATIEYIKELEGVVETLEAQKKQVERKSTVSNIDVVVSGKMAFFGVYFGVRRGLAAKVLMVFELNNVEILTANVSVEEGVISLTVTALVNGKGRDVVERIKEEVLVLLSSSSF